MPSPGLPAAGGWSSTPRPTPSRCTRAPATGRGAGCSAGRASGTSRWRRSLPEIRIDPLTGQRAIIAGDRAGRPGGHLSPEPAPPLDPERDPFAEGHEDRTPPELYAVRPDGGDPDTPGWRVRVVPNLYPALTENPEQPPADANPDLFWAGPAR